RNPSPCGVPTAPDPPAHGLLSRVRLVLGLALCLATAPAVVAEARATPPSAALPSQPARTRSESYSPATSAAPVCPVGDQRPCVVELHGAKAPAVSPNCTAE